MLVTKALELLRKTEKERDNLREAMELIAYPANHPPQIPGEGRQEYRNRIKIWLQAVAANALTNAGKENESHN